MRLRPKDAAIFPKEYIDESSIGSFACRQLRTSISKKLIAIDLDDTLLNSDWTCGDAFKKQVPNHPLICPNGLFQPRGVDLLYLARTQFTRKPTLRIERPKLNFLSLNGPMTISPGRITLAVANHFTKGSRRGTLDPLRTFLSFT